MGAYPRGGASPVALVFTVHIVWSGGPSKEKKSATSWPTLTDRPLLSIGRSSKFHRARPTASDLSADLWRKVRYT